MEKDDETAWNHFELREYDPAYLPGAVSFLIDKSDTEYDDNLEYTFIGNEEVYQCVFDTFFDPRPELGAPTEPQNETWAGLGGWIGKGVFRKLAGNNVLRERFVRALKNGLVGPKGEEGIKLLTGKGVNYGGVVYKYELKILGKGIQRPRLYGNIEKWANPKTKEVIDIVIFRAFQL